MAPLIDVSARRRGHWIEDRENERGGISRATERTIERMRSTGKGAILAAYMDYEAAKGFEGKAPGTFNLPGVLLADATIFAAGGFHLELGDGDKMLDNEYFPNHNLEPSQTLLNALQPYYDFVVAYEDLLSAAKVHLVPTVVTIEGDAKSAVWTFSRQCDSRTVVHLINLANPDGEEWRDPQGTHPRPTPLQNVRLKVPGKWHSAFLATPDDGLGAPHPVPVANGEIVIPKLDYWTMLVLQ